MKTNHNVTPQQAAIAVILLAKLENTINEKAGNDVYYDNIRILGSDYTKDIFINFYKVVLHAEPEPYSIYWQIKPDGTVDDDALHNLEFSTLGDRVHFFNSLYDIIIKK